MLNSSKDSCVVADIDPSVQKCPLHQGACPCNRDMALFIMRTDHVMYPAFHSIIRNDK